MSELQDSVGEYDPQIPHYSSTYNTDLPKRDPGASDYLRVSIQPWAAVHMKKDTLLGTLTFQISFQGKLGIEPP